jgi:pimeloyl-ACP methyl ester carboxylesterase
MVCITKRLVIAIAALVAASYAHGSEYAPCFDSDTFPELEGSVCTNKVVPLSYDDVSANSTTNLSLFIRKFPAPGESRGTVWLVAGGPGESGASLYPMAGVLRRSFPGFDLIIPDHRGTGYSSRLCPQEESVDSAGGMALVGAEWSSCFQRLIAQPELARNYSVTNAAHDLKYLIAHSDTGKPTYVYGVSYGTQLVLRALQLGKMPVTGIILDSLVPLQTATQWDLSKRSVVVDDIGLKVLADCDKAPQCHGMLGEKAETAYRRVLALAQQQPALVANIPGKDLKRFLGSALDVPAARARIPYLIKDLETGNGGELKLVLAALEKAGKSLGDYPQSPPSIPLVSIISASENTLRPGLTIDNLKKEEEALLFSSRLPELLVNPVLPLYSRDQYFGKLPAQFPPLLVFSGTLDPKTHYDGAVSHIEALKRSGKVGLVSVIGAPHFILWTAPECFERYAREFVQGRAPSDQSCAPPTGQP